MSSYGESYRQDSYLRQRSRSNYLTTLASISVVLFILGIFAGLGLLGSAFSRHARNSIKVKFFLHEGISQNQIKELRRRIIREPKVESVTYISKEEAGRELLERTGEDVLSVMGGINPMLPAFDVQFDPDYLDSRYLDEIKLRWEEELLIQEVAYPAEMILAMTQNVRSLSIASAAIGIILLALTFFLIFGTIRLSIYAHRLNIRTMELLGATQAFIRAPYIRRGVVQGMLGGILASGLLLLVMSVAAWWVEYPWREAYWAQNQLVGLLGGIVFLGLLLGFSGSYLAVNRYLNRNLNELM